jgi:exodeoxyribonuclease III
MRIITYNVNGIRSAIGQGFLPWVQATNADVVCLQESKAQAHQIPTMEFEMFGYRNYWFSAKKKGYSGVAILSKKEPLKLVYGINNPEFDDEGRSIRADFENFSVLNVYMPAGASGFDRSEYKIRWLEYFYTYVKELKKTIPNLIVVGDYNICHSELDLFNPRANTMTSGFLPEERLWLDSFLELGFIDSFRFFNKDPHNYTWWSYAQESRERNLGWRIDYICCDDKLENRLQKCTILNKAMHSDHCPVILDIDL